jgi:hypothetical protein
MTKIWSESVGFYHYYFVSNFNTRNKDLTLKKNLKGVFGSVVEVAFQNIFYSKMHQNNIFLFLKIYF